MIPILSIQSSCFWIIYCTNAKSNDHNGLLETHGGMICARYSKLLSNCGMVPELLRTYNPAHFSREWEFFWKRGNAVVTSQYRLHIDPTYPILSEQQVQRLGSQISHGLIFALISTHCMALKELLEVPGPCLPGLLSAPSTACLWIVPPPHLLANDHSCNCSKELSERFFQSNHFVGLML